MDVEFLPFYEDEFTLSYGSPAKWQLVVRAVQDLRADDAEAREHGVATVLSLLFAGQEEVDEVLPIIARRFARDLQNLDTDRSNGALVALENAINQAHDKEDCPSLEECAKQDDLRKLFIEEGKWMDTHLAYEHILKKEQDIQNMKMQQETSQTERSLVVENLVMLSFLVLLPIALFIALFIRGASGGSISHSFALAISILFSIEAVVIWLCFQLMRSTRRAFPVHSARVMAAVLALAVAVTSLSINIVRARTDMIPLLNERANSLALAQLFVIGINVSLIMDAVAIRKLPFDTSHILKN